MPIFTSFIQWGRPVPHCIYRGAALLRRHTGEMGSMMPHTQERHELPMPHDGRARLATYYFSDERFRVRAA